MNEQRRDFFKNSALGLATITLGAGLSLIPSAQAEEKPSNTTTTAVEKLPEINDEMAKLKGYDTLEDYKKAYEYLGYLLKE